MADGGSPEPDPAKLDMLLDCVAEAKAALVEYEEPDIAMMLINSALKEPEVDPDLRAEIEAAQRDLLNDNWDEARKHLEAAIGMLMDELERRGRARPQASHVHHHEPSTMGHQPPRAGKRAESTAREARQEPVELMADGDGGISLADYFRALNARPIRCPKCGREVALDLAEDTWCPDDYTMLCRCPKCGHVWKWGEEPEGAREPASGGAPQGGGREGSDPGAGAPGHLGARDQAGKTGRKLDLELFYEVMP